MRQGRRRVYSDNAVKYMGNQPDPHIEIGQRIVEVHGGRVWVGSDVGEGSTFYFTLPGE